MNFFRLSLIILLLSLIAGGVVHIRRSNWHYAYRINLLYEQYQRNFRDYCKMRLELARKKSPEHLLENLKEIEEN